MAILVPDAHTPSARTPNPQDNRPPARRRGRATAVVVLGLALIGGGGALAWPDGRDDAAAGSVAPKAERTGVAAPAPADASWVVLSGRAVASSPTAGPTRIDGPVHGGFARTPTGAALAALSIYTRCAFTPRDGWLEVTRAQVEPGKGRTAYIRNRRAVEWKAPEGGWGQTAGYRVISYSGDRALVQEAVRYASGTLKVQQLTVVWRDGDWRLQLQPDGSSSPFVAEVRNLKGFTPFALPSVI